MTRTDRRMKAAVAAVAAVAAGAAIAGASVRAANRRCLRDCPPIGRSVPTARGRVHLLVRGEGRPVALVHGADGVLQEFERTILGDVARDHMAVVVDRPGHGYSDPLACRSGLLAANVEAVREAVLSLGVERPVLLGHSYGAALALRWALDHPEEPTALVLVSPAAYFAWPRAMRRVFAMPATRAGRLLGRLLVPMGGPVLAWSSMRAFSPLPVPPGFARLARAMSLRPGQFAALAEEYRCLEDDLCAQSGRYGELRLPVEIVAGTADRVTVPRSQAERLAREIPSARLTLLPGVGHQPHWTHPEAVLAALRSAEERAFGTSSEGGP